MAVGLGASAPDLICLALVGGALTNYATANAHLGVGNSATAYLSSQTDLQGASKIRKAMYDGTFPSVVSNVITFKSRFADADAVWDWVEVGIFNAAAAGVMLTRDQPTASLGNKPNTQTWDLTINLTIT